MELEALWWSDTRSLVQGEYWFKRYTRYANRSLGLSYDASQAVLNSKWDRVKSLLFKYALLLVDRYCVGSTPLKFSDIIGCMKFIVLYWSGVKGFGRVPDEFIP